MREATIEDVREMLKRRPPTIAECDMLAAEELSCWDRKEVYAMLDAYHPPRDKGSWPE